jgi:endonuclease/exonuclease/phosphatase family metal-dependent hydrolase
MLCPRRVDLLVAIGFQQRFRVGRIALVPPDIPMDVVRLQEAHRVPQAGELTSPIMGRPARFEQHRRGRARHEELDEPTARHAWTYLRAHGRRRSPAS